jgi:uncharacterized protein (TIGR00661 family)
MSQSLALREYLEEAGHSVEAVYAGCNQCRPFPGYYRDAFYEKLHCFSSPFFLKTPNRKGIYIGRTILLNLLRSPRYLREIRKIRKEILQMRPDVVFNFYDLIGALAIRRISRDIRRIGIGHHFFLHLTGYPCKGGKSLHRCFLGLLTGLILRSCDRVLALSFREMQGSREDKPGRFVSRIEVVPPLVRKKFREAHYRKGDRYLVYLLNEGFITDLITIARNEEGFQADVFSELPLDTPVPEGIRLHEINDQAFLEKMACCRGLVTTAGFDSVAEAAYMGIPLAAIPVRNHFEQLCNSYDMERSGLGSALDVISGDAFRCIREIDNRQYRNWVDKTGEKIIKAMEE